MKNWLLKFVGIGVVMNIAQYFAPLHFPWATTLAYLLGAAVAALFLLW